MRSRFILTALALAVPAIANAEAHRYIFMSGNQLHTRCEAGAIAAQDFIIGINDAFSITTLSEVDPLYCLPKQVDGRQLIDVVCQYLEHNPATRNKPASRLVFEAFANAWPCDH